MSARKKFLLRLRPEVYNAIKRWSDDDLRSVNSQIEFLLRKALHDSGRLQNDTSDQNKGTEKRDGDE